MKTVSSQIGMLAHVHTSRRPRVISAPARLSPPPPPPPHPTLRDNPSDRYKAGPVLVRTLFAKGRPPLTLSPKRALSFLTPPSREMTVIDHPKAKKPTIALPPLPGPYVFFYRPRLLRLTFMERPHLSWPAPCCR